MPVRWPPRASGRSPRENNRIRRVSSAPQHAASKRPSAPKRDRPATTCGTETSRRAPRSRRTSAGRTGTARSSESYVWRFREYSSTVDRLRAPNGNRCRGCRPAATPNLPSTSASVSSPIDSSENHAKNSRGSGDIFHEANTPVKTITDDSSNIATEIPSTPTE